MSGFRAVLSALVLTLMAASPVCVVSQDKPPQRGPSTAEERAGLIETAKKLQDNPLDKSLQEQGRQLQKMLIHVPDIDVSSCYEEAPWFSSDYKYSQELVGAYTMSNAAFVVSNAEKPDLKAAHMAGLEGAIKAYQSIVAQDPTARWKKMEQLITKRDKGDLQKKSANFCATPMPLKAFAAIM